jgi:hypothetical protein
MRHPHFPLFLATYFFLSSCSSPYYTADDFAKTKKIDAHIHIETSGDAPIQQAAADNFQLFTINYDDANEPPPMEVQQNFALGQIKKHPNGIAYATTFSIKNFNSKKWLDESISYIANSVAQGAKAVKIYKVIGMSLRDSSGRLLMIDDPVFDPLISYLEKHHIPVVGHLGEPRNCWLPVDKMTVKGDVSYFTSQPEYHMFLHPEMPSYEQQINARDNMLAKHPDLKFVGAHLGSLEYDVDSLAARLDRFPNMAVDMAARIVHLQVQAKNNRNKVRDFLIKYRHRLLYATDIVINEKTDAAAAKTTMHDTWAKDWKFFTSQEEMTSPEFDGTFKGLELPKEVVDDIYYKNAQLWLGL